MIDSLPRFVLDLERRGSRIAFVDRTRLRSQAVSYAETVAGARRMAAALAERGVAPGDRVVLWAEPSSRWAMAFYALILRGAVAVPIDASYSAGFVRRVRDHTAARVVLVSGARGDVEGIVRLEDLAGAAASGGAAAAMDLVTPDPETLLEIVYTSGTTATPKGVTISHRNLLANLVPIGREMARYRLALGLVSPLVFVHLIPLSHLFGQVMALFVPQLAGGTVVFEESSPERVVRALGSSGGNALVCVPQQLEALLRHALARAGGDAETVLAARPPGIIRRWWRHRRLHRLLGLRLWAFIVGGAALPRRVEETASRLGFAVIQGYGLTETAPAVTVSHPLHLVRGSVGRQLPGVELRIADDGEVLVRGDNVTRGYYRDQAATRAVLSDGWLATGDLGRLEPGGHLVLLGRKKDVIVLADGRNVHPEDVEGTLSADRRLRECAVIGREQEGRTRVHAVLVLAGDSARGGADAVAADVVARANRALEPQQRIASFSLWAGDLPRTTTGKVKRAEVRARLEGEGTAGPAVGGAAGGARATPLERALERLRPGLVRAPGARLEEDLGLSSLDRLELMLDLEQEQGTALDEGAFGTARTVAELASVLATPAPADEAGVGEPRWPAAAALVGLRRVLRGLVVLPLLGLFVRVRVRGAESLEGLRGPVLYAANHQSLLDVPAILRALPPARRARLVPAMGVEEFRHALAQGPGGDFTRWRGALKLFAARLVFGGYLLPEGAGLRAALAHTGWLADRGLSPLVFPEGARTPDGKLKRLRPGVGVMAVQASLPVVPVFVRGLYEVLPRGRSWPRRGHVEVSFGVALAPEGGDAGAISAALASWLNQQEQLAGPVLGGRGSDCGR